MTRSVASPAMQAWRLSSWTPAASRASCVKPVDQHLVGGGLESPSRVPAADRLMRCTQSQAEHRSTTYV